MFSRFTVPPNDVDPAQQSDMLERLFAHGWSQQTIFLPDELTVALATECLIVRDSGAMSFAGTGRGASKTISAEIRGDCIAWLMEGDSIAGDRYLLMMENLRQALNRTFFLGLEEYESHFAVYAPGAFYAAHLDRFQSDDSRVISVVIYLNEDWLLEQGGALRLHPFGQPHEDITPTGSRMVMFLSENMLHEVMPATRERLSLAGWFRRRPLS